MSASTFGITNGVCSAAPFAPAVPTPPLVFATMYNYYNDELLSTESSSVSVLKVSDNQIALNPYGFNPADNYNLDSSGTALTLQSFLNLFYCTNGLYFNVNPSNINNPALILSSQKLTSSNSVANNFSLYETLLRAYCSNKGIHVNDMDPRLKILALKETFYSQSLAGIKGTCLSLSWDELMSALIASGQILPNPSPDAGNENTNIPLSLILNYKSSILDIVLSISFTYIVNMPGYLFPTYYAAQPTLNNLPVASITAGL